MRFRFKILSVAFFAFFNGWCSTLMSASSSITETVAIPANIIPSSAASRVYFMKIMFHGIQVSYAHSNSNTQIVITQKVFEYAPYVNRAYHDLGMD